MGGAAGACWRSLYVINWDFYIWELVLCLTTLNYENNPCLNLCLLLQICFIGSTVYSLVQLLLTTYLFRNLKLELKLKFGSIRRPRCQNVVCLFQRSPGVGGSWRVSQEVPMGSQEMSRGFREHLGSNPSIILDHSIFQLRFAVWNFHLKKIQMAVMNVLL